MSNTIQHSEKFILPIVATLRVQKEWRVSMKSGSDPEFSFARKNQRSFHFQDAFEARSDFLSIRSPEDTLRFFETYGPFQITPDAKTGTKKGNSAMAAPVRWSTIQQAQKDFGEALLADAVPYGVYQFVFSQSITLEWSFRSIRPEESRGNSKWNLTESLDDAAVANCDDVADALRVSIFLSRRSGCKWARCARKGCDQLFEKANRPKKLFCSSDCAHLQAANDYNARNRPKRARKTTKPSTKRR